MKQTDKLNPHQLALLTLAAVDGATISESELHSLICRVVSIAGDCLRSTEQDSALIELLSMAQAAIDPDDEQDPSNLEFCVECLDNALIESEHVADEAAERDEADQIALQADIQAAADVESMRYAHNREQT